MDFETMFAQERTARRRNQLYEPLAAEIPRTRREWLKYLLQPNNDSTDSVQVSEDSIVGAPDTTRETLKSAVEAPKARPLDLADDFEVVNGVPTFTWKDPLLSTPFHVMALSSDKTRMATIEKEQKICVYDMLDNFALIAESEKCFNRVNCVEFLKTRNYMVTVVHDNSTVSFLSTSEGSSEGEGHSTMELRPQKLQLIKTNSRLPEYTSLYKLPLLLACHTSESWVFASDPNSPNEFNIISILKQEYHKVKIIAGEDVTPQTTFMSIPYKALMSVVETESNNKTKKTLIWKEIDFKEEVIKRRPIEIEGQGIGFGDCGKYLLVWSNQRSRQSVLGLYELKALEGESPRLLSSILLPDNVLDAKAKFFDRNSIEFNNVDLRSHKNIPIIAFAVAHRKKVSLSFWDPCRNKILKQMDFTSSSMVWSTDAEMQFCLSPNLKWIALGGWSKGRFALFSLVSELLVWDGLFLDEDLALWPYSAFEFDASSTKLIINCSETLYACAPPCLVEDYPIEMCGAKYELSADDSSLLAPLTWEHQRLLSKDLLKRSILARLSLSAEEYMESFDVALSKNSEMFVILIWKGRPLLYVCCLDDFSVSMLRSWFELEDNFTVGLMSFFRESVSDVFAQLELSTWNPIFNVFLYPAQEGKNDHVVIFALSAELLATFKNASNAWTRPISFSSEPCLQVKQSNDGRRVTCLTTYGVVIVDLNRREPVYATTEKSHVFYDWIRNYAHGRTIDFSAMDDIRMTVGLVDVYTNGKKALTTFSFSHSVFIADKTERSKCCFPCTFHIGYSHVGYMENVKSEETPNELGLITTMRFISKKRYHRRLTSDQWNPHTKRMMNSLFRSNVKDYTMEFDDRTGHLWVIGITEEESNSNLLFIPFGPFSLDSCLPCLYMKDYPSRNFTMTELESISKIIKASFFTMTFNGKSNCDIALEEEDVNMAWKILHVASSYEAVLASVWKEEFLQREGDNRLTFAIQGNDYGWANTCLDSTINDMLPPQHAFLIRKCFQKLWTNFRSLAISLFEEDALVSNVCDLEIYDDVLNMDDYLQARVGTFHSTEDWTDASYRGSSFLHWRSRYEDYAIKIEGRGAPTKTKATLKVFYINDACKMGLKGIIRFLLMHDAPSYIFKSSLIKWVIIFKWETIWKRRSSRNLVLYLFYIGVFSTYTVCIAYYGESLDNTGVTWAYLFIFLCITGLMALYMAYKEVVQLITCCNDGEELFKSRLRGFQSYFSSPWNILEVMSYIMLLVVFFLHISCRYNTSATLQILCMCNAIEILMMWTKIWYYAQPFKKTGALVLLVENVIRDSVPFLLLVLAMLVGFGFTMHLIFRNVLYNLEFEEDNETKIAIDQGFGNPIKAMLTLFYAMVGMFDPTFFLDCGTWNIMVIVIFVSYLIIQMIMMLNMLIALMGDTFDRVKSTEEEQLLLGRARFIDACEAQLTRKQIEDIEKNVDKWLYVIFPKDQKECEEVRLWQGRVKTIEDRVEKMIKDSQAAIISEMKEENNNKVTSIRKGKKTLKSIGEMDAQSLKDMIKECFAEIRGESSI